MYRSSLNLNTLQLNNTYPLSNGERLARLEALLVEVPAATFTLTKYGDSFNLTANWTCDEKHEKVYKQILEIIEEYQIEDEARDVPGPPNPKKKRV